MDSAESQLLDRRQLDDGQPLDLNADRDDAFFVNVYLYNDHPYVIVSVLGPCVEVPEEDEDAYTIDFESISLNELVGAPPLPVESTTPATTE